MTRAAAGWCGRRWAMAVIAVFGGTVGSLPSVRANELPGLGLASAPKDVADMDIADLVKVRISPFDVSLSLDRGYQPSNSVSASRLDSPIRDLPFAIQAFTESFIEDQQPRDIFDVARYSPGVTYRSNDFNEGNANLAIRGFAVSSVAGGNIAIMRDGFHGPTIFDFTNISRVEIVKGPSSFLYGQVAPGGIVNIITKSPQSNLAASADARYGSYEQYRFDVDVTGPLRKKLFFRVAASYDQDSHYWHPYDAHSWDVSPSLLWQPTDRLSITLKYERFFKDETPQIMQKPGYGPQLGLVPTAGDPNLSAVDAPGLPDNWNGLSYSDFRRSLTSGLSGWVDLKTSEHWNMRAGYSHQDYQVDALFTGNFGLANNTTLLQGRRVRRQSYTNRDDTVDVQVIAQYALSRASVRLLLGAQYGRRRFDQSAGQAPNDPALGSDPTASPLPLWDLGDPSTWDRAATVPLSALTANLTDQTAHYVDRSAYSGITLGLFSDRLLILAGARLTSTEGRFVNRIAISDVTHSASAMTPQYGVLYKCTPALSAFASYSESFVPGGATVISNPDGTTSTDVPTRGEGIDVGVKASFFDGRVSGTLTTFDIRNRHIINDIARTDATGSLVLEHVQSGTQRSRGVELDATLTATDNWQTYLSYSYMDARITAFGGDDAAVLAQDPATLDAAGQANYRNVKRFHNAPLQMSAPHLANLWTRYSLTQQRLRGLYVAGGINFVYDQTLLPDTPQFAHQTYVLVNAMVGHTWMRHGYGLDLRLTGKNLTDEHYRPSQSTRGRPREILLALAVRF